MTERGLPIADGAPACPFVAFEDDRDERATSPDHRHRCYAEAKPAPRALAHQEAYCLSSAFPVCPTFQDWARREAARSRPAPPKSSTSMDAVAAGGSQRNPPRSWQAPPPWLGSRGDGGRADAEGTLWDDDDAADDDAGAGAAGGGGADPDVPRRGRGLSGSYADRVAADSTADLDDDDPDDDLAAAGAAGAAAAAGSLGDLAPARTLPPSEPPSSYADAWDDELSGGPSEPAIRRRRERESDRFATGGDERGGGAARGGRGGREGAGGRDTGGGRGASGGGGGGGGRERRNEVAPEWERAKPLEAYPTLRSRSLSGLSIPPIIVAVVALALAAAVLFALPGLLGFGSPQSAASASPSTPVITPVPSINTTPVPQPTQVTYTVKAGDTLSRIAGRFGITLQELIDANKDVIPNPDQLQIGDVLTIPIPIPTELPAASEIPAAT
ncbi:MAG TPA: LysM peptidoglycan-binding domain-containing protein [Candidatus Limnocylindrales bacterium]|nr:LysM peptidoglycan-binding domain-containing protein [Candidatus Limnocylindrales bacterium]